MPTLEQLEGPTPLRTHSAPWAEARTWLVTLSTV